MSDFVIDMRPAEDRITAAALPLLRPFDDMRAEVFTREGFSLALGRADDWDTWGPYTHPADGVFVALAGRIALEEEEWRQAERAEGDGGLACKAIHRCFRAGGADALAELNGNFVAFVHDAGARRLYMAIDRCGLFPCFRLRAAGSAGSVHASHPDILARLLGVDGEWDLTSLAEFLTTGKVSYPHTYYRAIEAVEFASIHTFETARAGSRPAGARRYFRFDYAPRDDQAALAAGLADAMRSAVRRRTLPRFGHTGISLSGGLDSRALLSAAAGAPGLRAFCFYDEPNDEFRIARRLADACGVELVPLQRDFDHYGRSMEKGIALYDAMANVANNHYLGFRDSFRRLGFDNIVAGFYCDYLFKGLALDRRTDRLSRREHLAPFSQKWYRPLMWYDSPHAPAVRGRLDALFPADLRADTSDIARLRREERRLFPLCYEPSHAHTTIAQRVLPWSLPIADNDILAVYVQVPPQQKLNTALYTDMIRVLCPGPLCRIPNANTGLPVGAPEWMVTVLAYAHAARNRFEKRIRGRIGISGSWPNWAHYLSHSALIESLWNRDPERPRQVFRELAGIDPYKEGFSKPDSDIKAERFCRFLTLKIWMDQRR